ncbi:MAG: hypothetical protein ABW068_08525 [Candidatus Thiodiazotropha sp.]
MYKKKMLALTVAALLPFSTALMAEEAATEGASASEPAAEESSVSEPAAVESGSEDSVANSEPATPDDPRTQRLKELDAQYEALRKRAEEAGVMLPERSPWTASRMNSMRPGMEERMARHSKMMSMTQEERDAYRQERYAEMRKRAEEMGVEMPETPPWADPRMDSIRPSMEERMEHRNKMMSKTPDERDAYRQERYAEMRNRAEDMGVEMPETPPWEARKQAMDEQWAEHQKIMQGMTDEQRAACHSMMQRHRGMGPGQGMGMGLGRGMGPQGWSQPGMMPYGQPGYGYGPGPYGQGNFWNPEQ